MCGIAGFLVQDGLSEEILRRMNDVIWRRGPDGEGFFRSGPVGLGMRRLSIIDLHGGWQPIYNEDRSVVVVFNGEIYNYKALRADLTTRGHTFATESDTEVLVHLYEEYGEGLAVHLEGMFAFALWDMRARRLLLARDRLGIKPLFIAQLPKGLLFGSEIKSLLATGLVNREIDFQALDELLNYTFITAPRTIYRHVRKVEPGTVLIVSEEGRIETRRYWSIPDVLPAQRSEREWQERLEFSLREGVRSHLVSDVPVGAFLSGGVDSGLMVALMAQEMDRPVETFTVGFRDAGAGFIDERAYARQIAERYRLNHHEIDVEARVEDIIGDIVTAFDEPFADDSVVPSYYVSKVAAQHVKVALTGLGGDELFAGYRRHLGVKVGDAYARIPAFLREGVVDRVARMLPEPKGSHEIVDHIKRFSRSSSKTAAGRYQDSMSSLPGSERLRLYAPDVAARIDTLATERVISGKFESFQQGTSVDRALKSDLAIYLADDILTLTDRLSMWHSLELRVPYLDHRFVEEAMSLPADLKIRGFGLKYTLKKIAEKWLPHDVIHHKKQGFEAPMGRWLRGPLRPLMEDVLSETNVRDAGIFDPGEVNRLKAEHLEGRRKNNKILFGLLMVHLWQRQSASQQVVRSEAAA